MLSDQELKVIAHHKGCYNDPYEGMDADNFAKGYRYKEQQDAKQNEEDVFEIITAFLEKNPQDNLWKNIFTAWLVQYRKEQQ